LRSIPWWKRSARREARDIARWTAPGLAAQRNIDAEKAFASAKMLAEQQWNSLLRHEPEAVLGSLEAAFEDNQAPAAAVGCTGDRVDVVLLFPGVDLIPERKSGLTPGGKPTLKSRGKTDRNRLYLTALGSTVLVTVKEAFAVSPATQQVSLVAVRHSPDGPVEPIYAGRFDRNRIQKLDWTTVDPCLALEQADDSRLVRKGTTAEVRPLNLTEEPDIAALVQQLGTSLST
jgi:hypothetical protein